MIEQKVKPLKEQVPGGISEQIPGSLEGQLPGPLVSQGPGELKSQIRKKSASAEADLLKEQVKEQLKPTKEITNLDINLNRHVFISGQTQSGKSVGAKFVFALIPKKIKAIFYDYKHDPNHLRFTNHFKIFTELSEIKKYFESDKTGLFSKSQKDMRVIYQPIRIETDVVETHSLKNPNWKRVNDLCNYVYKNGNIILFIDEIAPFTSSHSLPPALYDCYIMGASRGVTIVSITQRPNVVHNTMISESYTRLLFRHELESDRMKLKGLVGQEVADQLHKLPSEIFLMSYVNGTYERCHLSIPKNLKWIL